MNKLVVGCLVACLAGVSQGDNRYWNAGGDVSRPWTDSANWDDGTKGVPQPGDLVVVRDRGTPPLVVNDDDAALAAHVTFAFSAQKDKTAGDVVWNVSTNVDFQGTIGDWWTSSGGHPGRFIKRGAGDFNCRSLADDGNGAFKPAHWVIERGVFRYPQFSGGVVPKYSGYGGGHLTVSNGATVVIYGNAGDKGLTTTWDHVLSYGLITNAAPTRAFIGFNSRPEAPSEIYGPIGGYIRFNPSDSVNLYGTANTFPETRPNGRRGIDPQVIGVMKFEGSPSSLGTDSEINYDYNGPIWRYLGTEPQTVTKTMRAKVHSEYLQGLWDAYHPMTVDGGAYGALTMSGYVYVESDNAGKVNGLCVQGTNANPCVYKMTQRVYETTKGNGVWCPVHNYKRGSGVWEFPFAVGRTQSGNQPFMFGGFSIEEGTVRADVIADRDQPSSLGAGSLCFGDYVGTYDETRLVDWTISFGTTNALGEAATEGTLEYVGELQGYSSNRKMALLGDGRISNNGTNTLQMARVSARTAGEKTLTLAGSNDLDNVMSEISDGAGTVSVSKDGSGKWILRGNQTFSGDLRVKGGTLEVEASTNLYSYYRLTFMGAGAGCDGYLQPWKIAFYDKAGKNLTENTYMPKPWGDSGGETSARTVSREFLALPDAAATAGSGSHGGRGGYFIPGRAATYSWGTWSNNGPSYIWFTTENRAGCGEGYIGTSSSEIGTPTLGQPWTWLPIVIRLRSDLGREVASYDIAAGSMENRSPTSWKLEGSRDGVCWYELDRRTNMAYPGARKWHSDRGDWAAGARAAGAGFEVSGSTPAATLTNFRSVQVAEGAALVTTSANVGAIRALTIGVTGVGTIDGFRFAESGTVNFVGVPDRLRRALTFCGTVRNDGGTAANLNRWKFTVNGKTVPRLAMGYANGSFTLYPPGLLITLASESPKPIVVLNEDNDRYFCTRGEEGMTVPALEAYVDRIAGGKVTHFFMCPSGQRTSYDSKAWEPIWACLTEPGCSDSRWGLNAKLLHDRGIDIYQVWIRRCRELGISPWLSPRMNDAHNADMEWPIRNTTFWRTRKDLHNPGGTLNFASQEVQDYTFALVQEQLDRYDIDGMELDFMRFDQYFPVDDAIDYTHYLDRFVSRVHDAVVAAKAVRGHDVLLGVRVPTTPRAALSRGMDVGLWARSGWVDWVCASTPWRTPDYNMPVGEWRQWFGAAARRITFLAGTDHGVTAFEWERTDMTPELYAGFADVAWGSGADGVYLFNASYLESALATVCRKGLFPADLPSYRRRYPVSFRDTSYGVVPDDVQLPRLSDRVNRFTVRLGATPAGRVSVLVGVRQDGPFNPPITLNGVAPFRSRTERLDVVCRDHPDQLMPYYCRRFSFPPWAVRPRADNVIELQPSETKMSIGWVEITMEEVGE